MKGAEPIFIDNKSKVGILMLHGFTSVPRQFEELADFLSQKGFNISAPLIAGHGTSAEDLMKTSEKDWTKSAMDAYLKLKKISKKVFIIGNSFGSNLGLWLAKETGNEPKGIVTISAPIFLRFHSIIKLRLFTYGRFQKFYKKPNRIYNADKIDFEKEIAYPVFSVKNIKQFVKFLEKETAPNLHKIKIPILIASAKKDPLVHLRSVGYILKNIGSSQKETFLFDNKKHDIVGEGCEGLPEKIYEFIKKYV